MPGAITDSAKAKPQNKKLKSPGSTAFWEFCSQNSRLSIATNVTQDKITFPTVLPCSPASLHNEGSIPTISPTNTQTEGSG